jgi:hypothetical protein
VAKTKKQPTEGGPTPHIDAVGSAHGSFEHAEERKVEKHKRRPAGTLTVKKAWLTDLFQADNIGYALGRWYHLANGECDYLLGEHVGAWRSKGGTSAHETSATLIRSCGPHIIVGGNKVWVCVAAGCPNLLLASNGRIMAMPGGQLGRTKVMQEDAATGEPVETWKQDVAPDLSFVFKPRVRNAEQQARLEKSKTYLGKPRGPDSSDENRAKADWCEQIIKYAERKLTSNKAPAEWSPLKAYHDNLKVMLGEAVREARTKHGVPKEPIDFIKAAFGKTATMDRAFNRAPLMLDALKLCLVCAAPDEALRGQTRQVCASQLVPLAASCEYRFPLLNRHSARNLYGDLQAKIGALVPDLGLYGAAAGWDIDLTTLMDHQARLVNAQFAAALKAQEHVESEEDSDGSAVNTEARTLGPRRKRPRTNVR